MRSGSLPKRPQTERPVLSPAEVEALACAMTHERDRVLVRLLAYGGLRVGEALALRWSDVDLPRGMLTVRQSVEDSTGPLTIGPTKTYATRTITLPTALVADLARLETDGLVFANRAGGYLRYGNWRRDCWNPALKRSGVKARTSGRTPT
jgi:integrase